MERLRPRLSDDRGQSMVELALALPILVFVLIGGADLARAYALQLAVQNGARAGAEAAAINNAPTEALAIARARDEMSRTPGLTVANATVTAWFWGGNDTDDDDDLDGVGEDDDAECSDPPTVASPCFVSVRVQYTFRTVTPWPLIPNTANFDRTTTMRTIAKGS